MPYKKPPPLFGIWCAMRYRCENENAHGYEYYGGLGISVCERWQTYENFAADMGERPSKKHSIDRIDVTGNYEPGNCRWATQKEQCRNQKVTRFVTVEGVRHCAADLADRFGVKTDTIIFRAKAGLTLAQIENPDAFPDRAGLLRAGNAAGRKRAARTHCKHGHEFTPENTYRYKDGSRLCRQCNREKMSRYQREGRYDYL